MKLPIYQIDAFSPRVFGGNPAAIVPLENELPDTCLQSIAAENNLSETAFFIAEDGDCDFHLRWFTPNSEIELCGHATLATAWLLMNQLGWQKSSVSFSSLSGRLEAQKTDTGICIDLPERASEDTPELMPALSAALGSEAAQARSGANLMAIYEDEQQVRDLQPDFTAVKALHPLGVIVTAPGQDCDFVSRYFAPSYGIDEDPVTGSAHADLTPYWSARLGKTKLFAKQLSERGGELQIRYEAPRVYLTGEASLYLQGEIFIPD